MSNTLFDSFISNKFAKSIWESLIKKYGADDTGKRKYVTGKWLQFQLADSKPIMDQVHEYENLVADVLCKRMKMCEILQANVIIKKLPQSWASYCNHLKHKKKDMSLEELISHMKIEEANRLKDKTPPHVSNISAKANIVESSVPSFVRSKQGVPGKKNQKRLGVQQKKSGNLKKADNEKGKGACYIYGKTSHKAYHCYQRFDAQNNNHHQGTKHQAHLTEGGKVIAVVVSKVNLKQN